MINVGDFRMIIDSIFSSEFTLLTGAREMADTSRKPSCGARSTARPRAKPCAVGEAIGLYATFSAAPVLSTVFVDCNRF